jgi:hypothetical protein
MVRRTAWFFVAGLVAAGVLEALWWMSGYYSPGGYVVERIARYLWPSSVFKMALHGTGDSWTQVSLVYCLSFLANGVLYGFLGLLFGLAKSVVTRPRPVK